MKKKSLYFIFTFLFLFISIKTFAYDFKVKNADGVNIYYKYSSGYPDRGDELTVEGADETSSLVIPEKVKYNGKQYIVAKIGFKAFRDRRDITSVVFPNTISEIGEEAFAFCTSLINIDCGSGEHWISTKAFDSCYNLTNVKLSDNTSSIGAFAFKECIGLASIIIPDKVKTIGTKAFKDCSNLKQITLGRGINIMQEAAFPIDLTTVISLIENPTAGNFIGLSYSYLPFTKNTYENATLFVPVGTLEKYKTQAGWNKFINIKEKTGDIPNPETKKCDTPTISYNNGKLVFSCKTEGATYNYYITDGDIHSGTGKEVNLCVTYYISVFASKPGFDDSDVANATLCWIDVDPKTEGITNSVSNVRAKAVLIQNSGHIITISGAEYDTPIFVYNMAGEMVASTRATIENKINASSLKSGEIAIVRVGEKVVKVLIK